MRLVFFAPARTICRLATVISQRALSLSLRQQIGKHPRRRPLLALDTLDLHVALGRRQVRQAAGGHPDGGNEQDERPRNQHAAQHGTLDTQVQWEGASPSPMRQHA